MLSTGSAHRRCIHEYSQLVPTREKGVTRPRHAYREPPKQRCDVHEELTPPKAAFMFVNVSLQERVRKEETEDVLNTDTAPRTFGECHEPGFEGLCTRFEPPVGTELVWFWEDVWIEVDEEVAHAYDGLFK